jgi:tetratricopeptide (TPR) repeat protein
MVVYTFTAFIAFGSLSQHLFELDDLAYLKDLTQIRQDPSAILSTDRNLPGRPITDLALLGVHILFSNNATAFHIALVFCHLITTLLLTFTFSKTGLNQELSLLGGFFFLINLAHFRAIHWISCLAYPLALSLGCIGILAYIAYQEKTRPTWFAISLCGFVLALLAHPAAIVFPVFLVYLTWQNKQPIRPILITLALIVISLIGILKRFPQVPQAEHATAVLQWQIIHFIQHGFWYLGRLWVSTFTIFPKMSDIQTIDLAFGILAFIGTIFIYYCRIFPIAHWGIWMLLTLAAFITNPNQTHFESGPSRHLYFASAGSAILLAYLCQQLSLKISHWKPHVWLPKICLIFFAVTITTLSIIGLKKSEAFTYAISARTYLVNSKKETATQLFQSAVSQAPELVSSAMYERFLIANLSEGNFLNSSLHQALAHYPNNTILVAVRMIYAFQSDTVNPEHLTDRIVAFAQEHAQSEQEFIAISFLNLGYFYMAKNQDPIAETLFLSALKLNIGYPEAAVYLSQIYIKQNKIDEARQLLHLAITQHPTHIDALQNLASLYYREKNLDQAAHYYERILAQEPTSTDTLFKLGYIYMFQKKYAQARPLFETLTQQVPNSWQSFAYLGQCWQAEGNPLAAIKAYKQALKLNPNQPELKMLLQQLFTTQ